MVDQYVLETAMLHGSPVYEVRDTFGRNEKHDYFAYDMTDYNIASGVLDRMNRQHFKRLDELKNIEANRKLIEANKRPDWHAGLYAPIGGLA